MGRLGIAKVSDDRIQLHRLTRAILQADTGEAERSELRYTVETLLAALKPPRVDRHRERAEILPHLRILKLSRIDVAYKLNRLRGSLTELQFFRLGAICEVMADDGWFVLGDALVAAEFPEGPHRLESFRAFLRSLNAAAAEALVDLRLELDTRRLPHDQRHGWFTGAGLVDEGIAEFTGSAARRTGILYPIRQVVAELRALRSARLYVGYSPADAAAVGSLLERLQATLAAETARRWEVTRAGVVAAEDEVEVRDRLCRQADVRVALVTVHLLTDPVERDRLLDAAEPVVAFALSALPDGDLNLGSLHRYDIHRRGRPWDQLTRNVERALYVQELVDEIHRAFDRAASAQTDQAFAEMASGRAGARGRGDSRGVVPPEVAQTALQESLLDQRSDPTGPAWPAVERLVDWATDSRPDAPRLCALLGDVGMGKTTTAKLFTQRLLDLRERDDRIPLPILFDLRDVRASDLADRLDLDTMLDSMLAYGGSALLRIELTAAAVRHRIAQGNTVVVFDGLDEVLVHLGPHDQLLFVRQLFRAVDERSGSRMLMTSRSQFFRTLREEAGFFVGQDREGIRGENYLSLLMLPFRTEQIREIWPPTLGWTTVGSTKFSPRSLASTTSPTWPDVHSRCGCSLTRCISSNRPN